MIQLKINNMDHKAILTVPADYERVILALWTIGLDRDPEKYTPPYPVRGTYRIRV